MKTEIEIEIEDIFSETDEQISVQVNPVKKDESLDSIPVALIIKNSKNEPIDSFPCDRKNRVVPIHRVENKVQALKKAYPKEMFSIIAVYNRVVKTI